MLSADLLAEKVEVYKIFFLAKWLSFSSFHL